MAVTIPSFTKGGLPNAPTAGDLARVTDNVQGAWMADTQASWFSLLGEVVNVRDFGAKGNNSTDDRLAIQEAIDARTGIVYVPPGIYLSSGEITLKDHLTILGAGYLNSEIKFTGATKGFVYEPLSLTEAQIRLSGLRILGNGTPDSTGTSLELLSFKNATNLYFDQLNIRDTKTVCLYLETCYTTFMNQLRVEKAGTYGIHLKFSNVWSIAGCDFHGSTAFVSDASLYIEGEAPVPPDTVAGNGYGGVRDSNFEGNIQGTPQGGATNAIRLKGAVNVEVAANFMENYRESVIHFSGQESYRIRIALNAIHSGRNDADTLVDASSDGLAHEALIVEQNRFGGANGGYCFNPGATTSFAYRMNSINEHFALTHVAGFSESEVEKTSVIRQKEARLLNEGTISGATPSIRNLQYARVNNDNPETITTLVDGNRDQLIILKFENSNTTVQSNGNLLLAGKVSKTFAQHDTLTLLNVDENPETWVEACRSIN